MEHNRERNRERIEAMERSPPEISATISGPFDVFVSRFDSDGILTHTVSFQQGNVARGQGTVLEVERIRMNDHWHSLRDEVGSPLQVEGTHLHVPGIFTPAGDDSEFMEGRIEATCRS